MTRRALLAGVLLVVGFTASACLTKDNGGVINGPPPTTDTTTATSTTLPVTTLPLGTLPRS